MSGLTDTELAPLRRLAAATDGLDVLFLYGSRSRGDAHAHSDWDFGFIGTSAFDMGGLLTRLVLALGTDRVDLADLTRASGLLRYRVARDGTLLFERTAGGADRFRLDAIRFWCDAGPIIEREYEHILAAAKP